MAVAVRTILPPGAISNSYEKRSPRTVEITATPHETAIIKYKFLANNCAVAPGMTRSAEMRIIPTIFIEITIDIERRTKKRILIVLTEIPLTRAIPSLYVVKNISFKKSMITPITNTAINRESRTSPSVMANIFPKRYPNRSTLYSLERLMRTIPSAIELAKNIPIEASSDIFPFLLTNSIPSAIAIQ